jgi:hypothetical protein
MNELDERAQGWLEAARTGHNPSSADAERVRAALKARVLADPELFEPKPVSRFVPRGVRQLLGVFGAGAVLGFGAGVYVARASLPAQPLAAAPTALAPSSISAATASANGAVASERGGTVVPNAAATLGANADHGSEAAAGSVREPTSVARESTSAARESTGAAHEPANAHRGAPEAARRGTRAHAANEPESDEKPPSPLKAELDGLRRAQELVHQNEPAWALARLEELDRAQVGSVLLEERAATRAIAECMLGRPGAERDFSRRFPGSPQTEQVQASCEKALSNATNSSHRAPRQTESPSSRHE